MIWDALIAGLQAMVGGMGQISWQQWIMIAIGCDHGGGRSFARHGDGDGAAAGAEVQQPATFRQSRDHAGQQRLGRMSADEPRYSGQKDPHPRPESCLFFRQFVTVRQQTPATGWRIMTPGKTCYTELVAIIGL